MEKLNKTYSLPRRILFVSALSLALGTEMYIAFFAPRVTGADIAGIPVIGGWLHDQKKIQVLHRRKDCEFYKQTNPADARAKGLENYPCEKIGFDIVEAKNDQRR